MSTELASNDGYVFETEGHAGSHRVLLPGLEQLLMRNAPEARRLFDLGCGNGSVANYMTDKGFEVVGVDASSQGVAHAKRAYPRVRVEYGSVYDDLAAQFGRFPAVYSLEVVEHLYAPRDYAKRMFDLLEPGGLAIVSTPYHGYWKNLALALTGKMDRHFTALWDHGHIKFWSRGTLTQLMEEAGFQVVDFIRVGRVAPVAMGMMMALRRPA